MFGSALARASPNDPPALPEVPLVKICTGYEAVYPAFTADANSTTAIPNPKTTAAFLILTNVMIPLLSHRAR
jgi:hypothetical protein